MSEHFPNIPAFQYEGTGSTNPFAFRHYNPDEMVGGKSMKDHLRFAAPYWHVMRNELGDPFGAGTAVMPWDDGSNSVENAVARVDVFFEFLEKIGIDFYCWHDRDIAPELGDLTASNAALDAVVANSKPNKKKPASSYFGVPLASFPTLATRKAAPLRPMPTYLLMQLRRLKRLSNARRNSTALVTHSGAVAKVTVRCSTPT